VLPGAVWSGPAPGFVVGRTSLRPWVGGDEDLVGAGPSVCLLGPDRSSG
jgi:hypothetical protein